MRTIRLSDGAALFLPGGTSLAPYPDADCPKPILQKLEEGPVERRSQGASGVSLYMGSGVAGPPVNAGQGSLGGAGS
jgi:hypothetical protein